ncbi:RDD family protein [Streptomyces sp. NBC_00344]|uniref:RDD family protein n=1 Tax=Streptomyces sp. NBC_00344 TaxID=2975720 RepID=UPI002E20F0FF
MSAPTPAAGDGSPTPGYYPDPSIPGYVRYWNGGSWVPGTSRPAPDDDGGASTPAPPAGGSPESAALPAARRPEPAAPSAPAVEETGPVFFDEELEQDSRQEPSSVWQADASRQTGFGGDRDRRVSWGGTDPRTPAGEAPSTGRPSTTPPASAEPASAPPPSVPSGPSARPGGPALPTGRTESGVPSETVALRALRPKGGAARTGQADGTMAIRAVRPDQPQAGLPQQHQQSASPQSASAQSAAPSQAPAQQSPVTRSQPGGQAVDGPVAPGAGGGAASWPQQVQQLARPAGDSGQQGLPPWKPPVEDPFLKAAQAQASARPASLGRRLVARLIDTVVLGAVVGVIAVPFLSKAADHINDKIDAAKLSGTTVTVWLLDGTTAGCLGVVVGSFLLLGLLYEALPTARWGRTPGKKLCGIQVRGMESYEPPTFGVALTRWLVYGALGLLAIGVVNVLWCLFDRPWRQCWHDKAARTFVAGD